MVDGGCLGNTQGHHLHCTQLGYLIRSSCDLEHQAKTKRELTG